MKHDEFQFLKDQISKKDINVKIVTDSMYPYIRIGQVIKVSAAKINFAPFDIIVFLGPDHKLICHVVIKVFEDHLITRGAKSGSNLDEPILKSNILGVVNGIKLSRFFKLKMLLKYLSK